MSGISGYKGNFNSNIKSHYWEESRKLPHLKITEACRSHWLAMIRDEIVPFEKTKQNTLWALESKTVKSQAVRTV